ncbi:DUF3578 domain-containing protein [Neobacillus sp. FSL H8-0543]|uniref:MrcB family domain-containing protein n=1 Tax=Neobacillus sp. FSL H8-0543 TaxID=2954672 RepID=UPI0031581FE5
MQTFLQEILDLLKTRASSSRATSNPTRYKELIEQSGPDIFARRLGFSRKKINSSCFQRDTWVDCPWISFYSRNTSKPGLGYYLVYLFAGDGSCVYLSLNQGTEGFQQVVIQKRKQDLNILTEQVTGISKNDIDLHQITNSERPKLYSLGNVMSFVYKDGAIPSNEDLVSDFEKLFNVLESIEYTGFKFYQVEPQSLFCKVTAAELRKIKEKSEYYPKGIYLEISEEHKAINVIKTQLNSSIPTYANFYHSDNECWGSRVLEVIHDVTSISSSKIVRVGRMSSSNCYVYIANFHQVSKEFINKLVLKKKRIDSKEITAIANTGEKFSFPYERYDFMREMQKKTNLDLSFIKDLKETLLENGQIILAGPPGTGKTLVAEELGRVIAGIENVKLVQFHPSYTYEDFIEGLRPVPTSAGIKFDASPGVLMKWANEARDKQEKYVLIIDEMNRANLPKVFGELFYLLEYRDRKIDLQYSKGFKLPSNLYIIGTMNTADRNIRALDHALRRRFEIFELGARSDLLRKFYNNKKEQAYSVDKLIEGFTSLNNQLRSEIDRHHEIGHSYFMKKEITREILKRVWDRKIFPLIEEYYINYKEDKLQIKFNFDVLWPEEVNGTDRDDTKDT